MKAICCSLLLSICVLSGCAYNESAVRQSYRALSISETSYDSAMLVFADLVKQDAVDLETRVKVMKAASMYSQIHNAAVDALVAYKQTESLKDWEEVEKQTELAAGVLSELLSILKPYLIDGE